MGTKSDEQNKLEDEIKKIIYKVFQIKQVIIKEIRIKFEGKTNQRAALKIWRVREGNKGKEGEKKRMSTPNRRSIDYMSRLGIQGPPKQYKHHPISNYLVVKPPFTCRLNGAISINMLTCAMHTPCIFFLYKKLYLFNY